MARNKYPGYCYVCNTFVPEQMGHFERHEGKWRVKCSYCANHHLMPEKKESIMYFRGCYDFLSNMYETPIKLGQYTFRCVESAFQACKNPNLIDEFINLNGYEAKKLGRQIDLRPDWEQVKQNYMYKLLKIKFSNPVLKYKLCAISRPIIENNDWGDTYWGMCNGQGQNVLGSLLEKVRMEYRNELELNAVSHANEDFYVLIAGSRTYDDYDEFRYIVDYCLFSKALEQYNIHIVEGEARGADTLAKKYAEENEYELHKFPADWDTFGKSAGFKRNDAMHDFISHYSNRACLCFWDGQSKGTQHNFELARKNATPLRVWNYSNQSYVTP